MISRKQLRVLDFGFVNPLESQAVFHGIAQVMRPDDIPVLTLVNPNAPYVCVGLHQEIALEVDESYCQSQGLPIIRRHVGGGAVYLDHNQMFFHFIFPQTTVPRQLQDLYQQFIEPVVRTYQALGIDAVMRPVNDIHVNGRKIGGTGAATIEQATLVVGSFLFDFDTETMARCLKVPSEKFRDKLRQGLNDYMTTMTRELPKLPSRDVVKNLFLQHIEQTLGLKPVTDAASEAEQAAIAAAVRDLSDPEWTYAKGRRFDAMGIKISADTHLTTSAHKAPGGLIRVQLLNKANHIVDLLISGDFTCQPAQGVDQLATLLTGSPLEPTELRKKIEECWQHLDLDIPGVQPADLCAAIEAARQQQPA